MAGDAPKPSSSKRPPPSSSSSDQQRRSRWESSSPAAGKASAASKPADAGKSSRPSNTDSKKPTPNRGPNPNPNPSPAHPNPSPAQAQTQLPSLLRPSLGPPPPPPPPTYGFHMLDRRTIVLADGSVRSYFALPPDYQDFVPPPRPEPMGRFMSPGGPELGRLGRMSPNGLRDRDDPFRRNPGGQDYWNSLGLEGRALGPEGSMKRKFGEGEERERDELARQRMHLLQYGNAGASLGTGTSSPFAREDEFRASKHMRIGGGGFDNIVVMRQEIDPAVMKAFLHFAKLINDNANQRRNYLENGKHGPVQCLACGRSSKDFPDVHALVMHTYYSDNADLRMDHLGLHRALCVLMGWSYMRPPDNSQAYQFLPADEAAANQDDLILWPPMVIIHNTSTGKGKDGRMEGMGNKAMDSKLRDLGFPGGKSHSLYNREGHRGITLVKFANDRSGLEAALRLADYFEKERRGRREWARVQSMATGHDDDNNPDLVSVDDRTKERKKILYGYLGTASDLEKLDFETRKKVAIESKREKLLS